MFAEGSDKMVKVRSQREKVRKTNKHPRSFMGNNYTAPDKDLYQINYLFLSASSNDLPVRWL